MRQKRAGYETGYYPYYPILFTTDYDQNESMEKAHGILDGMDTRNAYVHIESVCFS
jgi:hypothetical protein